MKFIKGKIPGLVVIEPDIHKDGRGFFLESYHAQKYEAAGIQSAFVQDNHSCSSYKTLRGLHAQLKHPQAKLVRVIEGEVFDVQLDIRLDSPTFGQWHGLALSASNQRQVYVPCGFAHGFCVTSERAQVEYKCTDFYDPEDEITILWSDPDLDIKWPVKNPILSEKDMNALRLSQLKDRLNVMQNTA